MSETKAETKRGLNILVAGCIHGFWDELVNAVKKEIENGNQIDVVLVNGDNQTFRKEEDMESSYHYLLIKENRPTKYGKMPKYTLDQFFGSFHKYMNPEAPLPCLFILIGGNNECEDLLYQMPYGGFIADNIYYTGRASIIDFCGLRIGALSGVYVDHMFNTPIFEKFPIRGNAMKTVHYVRSFSQYQLMCYENVPEAPKINVIMTHDWPNDDRLRRRFRNVQYDSFKRNLEEGNIHGNELLCALHPKYWTAAHHHVKLVAEYYYNDVSTNFIANPRPFDRNFYSIIHFDYDELNPETRDSHVLSFAPEWIAILQSTQNAKQIREEFEEYKWSKVKDKKDDILQHLEKVKKEKESNPAFLEVPYKEYDPCKATEIICTKYVIRPPEVEEYDPPNRERTDNYQRGRPYYQNRGRGRGRGRGNGGQRGRGRGGRGYYNG